MKFFLLSILLFLSVNVFSGEGHWVRRISLPDLEARTYEIRDRLRSGIDLMPAESYRGFIFLDYTRKEASDLSILVPWRLKVNYSYYNNGVLNTGFLFISSEGEKRKYSDFAEIPVINSTLGYGLKVSSIEGSYLDNGTWVVASDAGNDSHIPTDIDFKLELRSERVFDLNQSLDKPVLLVNPSTYEIKWNFIEGAELYDLEWVHIDVESREKGILEGVFADGSQLNAGGYALPFDLKEASRVRVWGNSYQIDKTFTEGIIYFRVRVVSNFVENNESIDQIRTGTWNYFTSSNLGSEINSAEVAKLIVTEAAAFEKNKNWLYGVSYAEEGKSVSSVTIFDGSNRGRQNLVYNTSDNITLISESKYDFEGRQTISVIPAPVKGRKLGYKTNFNLALDGTEFSEEDFDKLHPDPLLSLTSGESGAAQYFSENNQFTDDMFRAAIPDANGYVYSQTIYRNDGTGRIERVGGIGEEFKVDGNHAIETFYGSPMLIELKRLFGSNVSDELNGYRKEMVKDANGQYSVTYYDKRGNVIATGLTGESPTNLIELDGLEEQESVTTSLNNNNNQLDAYTKKSEHTFLNAIAGNRVDFTYNLKGALALMEIDPINIGGELITFADFCSSCQYDLDIDILNQQGGLVHHEQEHFGPVDCQTTGIHDYGTLTFPVTFNNIGEYRIIKTLRVDATSMQAAFDAQLASLPSLSQEDFIENYIANTDLSACFDDCDSYCEFKVAQQLSADLEINVQEAYAQLLELKKDNFEDYTALLSTCINTVCNEDVNFDAEFGVGTAQAEEGTLSLCDAMRNRMLKQLSPGNVFWSLMPASIVFEGQTYAKNSFEGPNPTAIWEDEMAANYLTLHRENCHLVSCDAMQQSTLYSLKLGAALDTYLEDNDFSVTNALFLTPQNTDLDSYLQDPFLTSVFNVAPGLVTLISDFKNIDETSKQLYNGTNFTGTLAQYAQTQANQIIQASPPQTYNTPQKIKELILSLFMGAYNQTKQDLIVKYKGSISCAYYDDDDAVFIGTMSYEDILSNVSQVFGEINFSINCQERAIDNTYQWLSQISDECLEDLGINISYNQTTQNYETNFTESSLITAYNNNTSSTLPELMYAYSRKTCPQNTYGWFYDPGVGQEGKTQYNSIKQILTPCFENNIPFEVIPAPTTTSFTIPESVYNIGNQEIVSALNTLADLVNQKYSSEVLGSQFNSTENNLILQAEINNMQLNGGLIGSAKISNQSSRISNGFGGNELLYYYPYYEYQFTLTQNDCDYNFTLSQNGTQRDFLYQSTGSLGYPQSGQFGYNIELVGINDFHINEFGQLAYTQKWLYFDNNGDCTPWNPNSNFDCGTNTGILDFQAIYTPTLQTISCLKAEQTQTITNFSSVISSMLDLPDYQADCINSEIQQATIDAQLLYQEMLGDLRNEYASFMLNCLDKSQENFKMTYELKEYQYTLYYYDLANNLVQTVPPQGVAFLTPDDLEAENWDAGVYRFPKHQLETRYKYNGLNTLITQFTPDGGVTNFYHDQLYRVRFSQNDRQSDINLGIGKQLASYSKYDELGRVVEAGEFALLSESMEDVVANYVNDNTFPLANQILDFTKTYYEDVYNNGSDQDITNTFVNGQENLRNAIGAIEHRQAEYTISESSVSIVPGSLHKSVTSYSYDPHKNVKQVVNSNYDLQTLGQKNKSVEYEYDLISGNVNQVIFQRAKIDQYRHQYHYDANNRLVRAFTSDNDGITWEMDAKYFYYLHGALARTELGHDKVTGIDYAYNLQGWLKGVNSSTLQRDRDLGKDGLSGLNENFGQDVFGFQLGYFETDYTPIGNVSAFVETLHLQNKNKVGGLLKSSLYNGNISHMLSAISKTDEVPLPFLGNNYRYDQLQRIKAMDVYSEDNTNYVSQNGFSTSLALHNGIGTNGAYQESYSFDKNGNLTQLKRNGSGRDEDGGTIALQMDDFKYKYYNNKDVSTTTINPLNSNRLSSVDDNITVDDYTTDIASDQLANNYKYDKTGQLISDAQEHINNIEWTVTGKVKAIYFTEEGHNNFGKNDLKFIYDPMDMRIAKVEYVNEDGSNIKYTYYSYDATGNVMATYTKTAITTNSNTLGYDQLTQRYSLNEHHIYGSARIGAENQEQHIANVVQLIPQVGYPLLAIQTNNVENSSYDYSERIVGDKNYELANHLGNVLNVITDRKIPASTPGIYTADVVSYSDYSPYGVQLDGRHSNPGDYRYGFNGEESVDEVSGEKNSYDYGNRFYDARLGRFLSIDAYSAKYPYISPYSFAINNPIIGKDVGGDSVLLLIWATNFKTNSYGHAAIAVQNYKNVDYTVEILGQKITFTTRVPDGTYTFYDLWPAEAVGADKESTQTPVNASYHNWKTTSSGKILTKDELMKFTVNGSEKTGPDGVIIFATSKEMDGLIKSKISQYTKSHPKYVGASNNCSDFALSVLQVLSKDKLSGAFGKETFMLSNFTTPNQMFKDSKSSVNSGILDGQVLKDNNNFKQPFITNSQSGGYGSSSPVVPIEKSAGQMGVQ